MRTSGWERWILPTAVLGAIALFGFQLAALAMHRVDYPVADDWRYYVPATGLHMPETLTLGWLLAPAADTLHATGKLCDWLVLHLLAHDYSVLAITSFALVLGGWLAATLRLCFVLARGKPFVLLLSLAVLALPLAGVPYWVTVSPLQWLEPAVAYHQMMPLLGLSVLALVCTSDRLARRPALAVLLAGSVTALFSLAYASGAAALGLFGGAVLALAGLRPRERRGDPLLAVGVAVVATAAASLALHVVLPLRDFGVNPVVEARHPEYGLTLPSDARFWLFLFALFDRALLSTDVGVAEALRGALVALLVALPALGLAPRLRAGTLDPAQGRAIVAVAALTAAVVGYAGLVSYGRADFGGSYFPRRLEEPLQVALYAKSRFFFWWVTALLPVTLIGWGLLLERARSRRVRDLLLLALAVFVLWPKSQRPGGWSYARHWDYAALYQRDAEELAGVIAADVARSRGRFQLAPRREQWRGLPPGLRNPSFYQYPEFSRRGLEHALEHAERVGATFGRRLGLY